MFSSNNSEPNKTNSPIKLNLPEIKEIFPQQATRPSIARDHLSVLLKQRHHGVEPIKATPTQRRQSAQQATSNKQQATSNKQQATSNKQQATSNKQLYSKLHSCQVSNN
jgi:hypothetical protein